MANKLDIISNISEKCSLDKNRSKIVIDQFCEYLTATIAQGETVSIAGFGSFTKKIKKSKIKTGEEVEIADIPYVEFKAGETLIKRLNHFKT